MREGSLEPPVRHPIAWQDPDFYDMAKIEAEMHRVFDICHGCRRCFNLCDSFPRLFDLVDAQPDEVAGVDPKDYKQVVDACTLCDLCFMTKCPYVPPHEWALDFPHLMLRYRSAELKAGKDDKIGAQVTETDRNGRLASYAAPIANAVNANPAARAYVHGLKEELVELYDRHGAVHFQLGRAYPYVERLEAPAAMLAQAVKQTLDPHGRIGPGVLGF